MVTIQVKKYLQYMLKESFALCGGKIKQPELKHFSIGAEESRNAQGMI